MYIDRKTLSVTESAFHLPQYSTGDIDAYECSLSENLVKICHYTQNHRNVFVIRLFRKNVD